MRLFHRTSKENSEAILKEGFRDVTARYYKQDHPDPRGSFFPPIAEFTEGTGVLVSSGSSISCFLCDEPLGSDLSLRLERWEETLYDTPTDQIVDLGPGPYGEPLPGYEILTAVEIPEDVIGEFLWRKLGGTQQFLAPAFLLNLYDPPVVVDEEIIDDPEVWLKKQIELNFGKERWWHWFRNQGDWISDVFEFLKGCVYCSREFARFIIRVGKFIFNNVRNLR